MAGAGYKLFNTGDVLTAAQVNTYLQEQTVMVFANAAARTTALASVLSEGMVTYLKDTNSTEVYDGSAWVAIGNSGDITGVTAGTGISGGGTSGTVTITNAMATEITAAGDIIVGTGSGTFDNLPIGTTGQILTADTTVSPYKVKWATAASGGGMTSIASGSLSGSTTTIDSISGSYNNLVLFVRDYSSNDDTGDLQIRFNNDTTANFHMQVYQQVETGASYAEGQLTGTYYVTASGSPKAADNNNSLVLNVYDYATSGIRKNAEFWNSVVAGGGGNSYMWKGECGYQGTNAITRIDLLLDAGSFDGGTYVLYGVK
jgi:hypothetical protein